MLRPRRRKGTTTGCAVCKQLVALCCFHAKCCTIGGPFPAPAPPPGTPEDPSRVCPVPFCANIRAKLAQTAADQRFKQSQLMRRRMQTMGAAMAAASAVSLAAGCY